MYFLADTFISPITLHLSIERSNPRWGRHSECTQEEVEEDWVILPCGMEVPDLPILAEAQAGIGCYS